MTMLEKIARRMYEKDRAVTAAGIENIWAELLADPNRSEKVKTNDRRQLAQMRAETFETCGMTEEYFRRADAALDALSEFDIAFHGPAVTSDWQSLIRVIRAGA